MRFWEQTEKEMGELRWWSVRGAIREPWGTPLLCEQAQEHLTTATTMYREMGMTYWLEHVGAEMRGLAW